MENRRAWGAWREVAFAGALCAGLAACGAPAGSSAAACAPLTRNQRLAAPVIVVGTFASGPTVDGGVLIGPATFNVRRYVKGRGPDVVRVTTRELGGGSGNSEGIAPKAGEQWRIYAQRHDGVLHTSVCDQSHRLERRRS